MSNIKEIASIHAQFKETAKKIAEGSKSVVDLYNFYMDNDIFLSEEEDIEFLKHYDMISVKKTCIVSIDTLNPRHLIQSYEEFLVEPYSGSEDSGRMESLEEVMAWICATGVYFGASEGDGACIGFWEFQDEDSP